VERAYKANKIGRRRKGEEALTRPTASSETSVIMYQAKWGKVPEESILNS
jgi:hypothetical protein